MKTLSGDFTWFFESSLKILLGKYFLFTRLTPEITEENCFPKPWSLAVVSQDLQRRVYTKNLCTAKRPTRIVLEAKNVNFRFIGNFSY